MSERIIHDVVHLVTTEDQIVNLCDAGRYREAAAALEGFDPNRYPLAFGMVEIARGNPELAKDYLLRAIERGAGDKARVQLGCAYYHAGEMNEALAIADTLPNGFGVLLLRAIIESDSNPRKALRLLDEAARFAVPPGMQARLHNQRAIVLRRTGETDRAIQEYDAAIHYFEEAGSDCVPFVINNLASVFKDCADYASAHTHIDRAITLLVNDRDHLAKAYDQKARILLAEKRFDEAERYARMAVRETERSDRKAWLAECLTTHVETLLMIGEITRALAQSDRVEEIGRFLNNDHVILEICPIKKEIAAAIAKGAEIERINAAIRITGSIRGAARKLGVSHVAILRTLKRYDLQGSFPAR